MPTFTPWCHTKALLPTAQQANLIFMLCSYPGMWVEGWGFNHIAVLWIQPRAESIFKGDDCTVKQNLNPITAADTLAAVSVAGYLRLMLTAAAR